MYAAKRGDLARVCKLWHDRIYNDGFFWNYLSINQHVDPEDIFFVLLKCGDANLHICISLLDVFPRRRGQDHTHVFIALRIIFLCISFTAHHWVSFQLFSENPAAFLYVQERCQALRAPRLETFSLCYYLMEGYSAFHSGEPIYHEPLNPRTWFGGGPFRPRRLQLHGAAVSWTCPSILPSLVMLDLVDVMGTAIAVDWDSLSLLFSIAQCLRFMRLGVITPFAIPDGGVLSSNSLNVLDIFIADDEFAVDLMLTMEVPGLTDLTLRARYSLGVILRCTRILGQLTWFALQGNIFRGMSFFELFDSMPL
ncbi:hypothetical protein B0H13DRAFT_2315668 [Mycena leptocephala]|nr:hypothetical protein B0H13DRAFT_2315668 [Mycena leptocephala]